MRLHIFKSGTHTAENGQTLAFTESDVAATARAYDPATHEAPVVVGHPKSDGPAYGWVKGLSSGPEGLVADVDQVNPTFQELLEKGAYKKVSAAFYPPDGRGNPKPGTYYLRHVGFLGAQPPAIKGLKAIQFAGGDEDLVTVQIAFAEGGGLSGAIVGLFSRIRDYLIEKDGADAANKVIGQWDLEALREPPPPSPAFSEADEAPPATTPIIPTQEEPTVADANKAVEDLAAREKALAEREATLATKEALADKADCAAFAEGLLKEGKLPPACVPTVTGLLAALPKGDGDMVAFAEGGEKTSPRDHLKALLKGLGTTIHFAEVGADQGGQPETLNPEAIARRAVAFRETEAAAGRVITTTEAVAHVLKETGMKETGK
ncbi:hypothetical protein [Rhodospirillum sp. A1_3_36]|uniref:hypothetical protein n=1 Tax=Rhodospirillum sp. A1_3_36 TaxID=3391666 RepID=UPI0039A5E56C